MITWQVSADQDWNPMTRILQHTHTCFCPPGLQRAGPRQTGDRDRMELWGVGLQHSHHPLFPQSAESQGNEGTKKQTLFVSLLSKSESQSGPQRAPLLLQGAFVGTVL